MNRDHVPVNSGIPIPIYREQALQSNVPPE